MTDNTPHKHVGYRLGFIMIFVSCVLQLLSILLFDDFLIQTILGAIALFPGAVGFAYLYFRERGAEALRAVVIPPILFGFTLSGVMTGYVSTHTSETFYILSGFFLLIGVACCSFAVILATSAAIIKMFFQQTS